MSTQTQAIVSDVSQLAQDARALMVATADMAGDQVEAARKRLAAALDSGRDMCGHVKDKAIDGAKAANVAMHDHPYTAVATGIGLGAILGYLIARR